MSGNHHADPKAIRAGLDFPVIDSDGHWLEYGPVLVDYLKKVGGNAAVDGFLSRDRNVASTILMGGLNRVLLLSDGLANSGETNLDAIASAVNRLAREGVSTTTMGVGVGVSRTAGAT